MSRSAYKNISQFGSSAVSPINNPLTYCMGDNSDQRFLHGGHADTMGQHSKPCQSYMSDYCSVGWDAFCEVASHNGNTDYPNNLQSSNTPNETINKNMTAGEILIRNTAAKKYLIAMGNCKKKFQPFDPLVASSPMISYWYNDGMSSNSCIPVYAVNPATINDDIVMNKILQKPIIAFDILLNIYNTMKRQDTLKTLKNTNIGHFFDVHREFK